MHVGAGIYLFFLFNFIFKRKLSLHGSKVLTSKNTVASISHRV